MAYTFIGKSPDPLPIPGGMQFDPRRFIGSTGPPASQRPPVPTQIKLRYMYSTKDGRIKPNVRKVELPPEAQTVRDLHSAIYEFLNLSPRHPIELRYWGEKLDANADISTYSIKQDAELSVVVKPLMSLAQAQALSNGGVVTRLRVFSHKLGAAIPLEGLTAETKVADLLELLKARLAQNPIFLVKGQAPPGTNNPPPVQFISMMEESVWVDGQEKEPGADLGAKIGDMFIKDAGGGGGGKKGAGGALRRVAGPTHADQAQDGWLGSVGEPDLWEFKLEPEQKPALQYGGLTLNPDALVSSYEFIENEIVHISFMAPWEPDDPVGKPGGGAEKGGKKKK